MVPMGYNGYRKPLSPSAPADVDDDTLIPSSTTAHSSSQPPSYQNIGSRSEYTTTSKSLHSQQPSQHREDQNPSSIPPSSENTKFGSAHLGESDSYSKPSIQSANIQTPAQTPVRAMKRSADDMAGTTIQEVGGRKKLLKRTPTKVSLDVEEDELWKSFPEAEASVTHIDKKGDFKQDVKQQTQEPQGKEKEKEKEAVHNPISTQADLDKLFDDPAEVKLSASQSSTKTIEIATDAPVDEDEEELNPTAPITLFDSKAELVDKWDKIQEKTIKILEEYCKNTFTNTFELVYTVSHLFHKTTVAAQKDLREGLALIEAEEAKQEKARQIIVAFSDHMAKVAESLQKFGLEAGIKRLTAPDRH